MAHLRLQFTLLILFILVFTASLIPSLTAAQEASRLYGMPVSEVSNIITDLFTFSNLEVLETELDSGKIRIFASNQDESWQIIIQPRSALGARVEVELYQGPISLPEKVELFWDEIAQYRKNSGNPTPTTNQLIPPIILSKIASVGCVYATLDGQRLQISGFLIDNSGLILSTAHDLEAHGEVRVVLSSGLEYTGDIIRIDVHRDLALIKINATRQAIISPPESRNLLGMGEKIFSVGCPASLRGTVFSGSINGPPRMADNLPLWQAEMQIMPGSSGSPVFDSEGKLVAVVKGRYRGTDRIGFLIPIETVIDFLGEI